MLLILGLLLLPPQAQPHAAEITTHALALYGEPKYPADFSHFAYVNPKAPKGNSIHLAAIGGFNSFNTLIPKGDPAPGIAYETLVINSRDEPFSVYGLIAEKITLPDDRSWITFHLNPQARWHDGKPITADDVIYSFTLLTTKAAPFYRYYYADVSQVLKISEHQVRFNFKKGTQSRELPLIIGQMPVLPKHYWEQRAFDETTLEPPLLSGPYRIKNFEAGRSVTLERVPNYWGRDLAINRGRHNFDEIRYDMYRDRDIIRQALKAGDVDFMQETQAKAWAQSYNTPAVDAGFLKLQEIPDTLPRGMQGWYMNIRNPQLQDRRVRQALQLAFDFEWTNSVLFFDEYQRSESFFSNSELAAQGRAQGQEIEILAPYQDRIWPEVLSQEYHAPKTDGNGWPRANLTAAAKMLEQAGWIIKNFQLVHEKTNATFPLEIMLVDTAFVRVALPFVHNLKRLGINATIRIVDSSQYLTRIRAYDFDMIVWVLGQSESPGNEQRGYWGSEAAQKPGSSNLIGIQDPVIDAVIQGLINAPSRASLVAHARALDRLLLWGAYVIPHWYSQNSRFVYWKKFGQPQNIPAKGTAIDMWWVDSKQQDKLNAWRRGN